MSLREITSKHRRSELKTGVHLVTISDMFYLRNAEKEIIKFDGFPAIIIQFKGKTGLHEQLYVIDKGNRQFYFDKVLSDAKVPVEPGKPAQKVDCVGKKLYVAIREVRYVNDENVVMENGEPVIEYQIFQTIPSVEGIIPNLKGDPALNNDRPMDQFVTYKNTSTGFLEVTKEPEINISDEWTPPNFDI